MMKDGARFFSGLEEAVIRNIGACKEFAETVQTCYGPNGMNKMVINHLEKLFVTNDAATIIRELEVEHPAAKMMILGSQMMEQEVAEGYELACRKALEFLDKCACHEIKDAKNQE